MAGVLDAGTSDIRNYVETNWLYVAFFDSSAVEKYRVKTDASNVTWVQHYDNVAKELKLTVVITGQTLVDAGGTLPITLRTAKFFKGGSGGSPMSSDDDTDVTLAAVADQVTATITCKIPA